MRLVSLGYALLTLVLMACVGLFLLIYTPQTPLPDALNPTKPLNIADPVTPLTAFKLRRALTDGKSCRAALGTGAQFGALPDLETSPQCGIADRVTLRQVGQATMRPVETRCQTALRLAMWHQHGIVPAATQHFGQGVRQVHHASSYNCRQIRTTGGGSGRLSTHATAEAVDISGVTLADGRRVDLINGWGASDPRGAFFVDLRDSACMWFRVTLGPDYNALHADHFHLQHTGWGLCR
ncbi:extensin family protein [uncultured Tateyamaria sp.]|uniref:extensin-like domain-containing protein n=1 Tax=uncultured Tateyamaria sp. TaxID=455651 RepID=UPI0026342D84|nr:extensin family protein [uncultured Tateyamaria sp.]